MRYVFSVKHLKLTFVKPRAVVDLCLERLVCVPGGRAHLPGCLEHDVVPEHRGTLPMIRSCCLNVNLTSITIYQFIYV